ncbi:unnamed protein product [Prunus armeniaca]
MKGEIEVRDASNESLVVFSTSVPNATDNFGGMPPKLCTFFGWISPVRNLIFGGDPPNLLSTTNLIQAILILLPLKEQNQGDTPIEGNNVGTECLYKPRENQSAFDTYMRIEKFPEGIRKYITHQTEVLPDVQSSETKLNEIAIGFVDDDHYVQVHLSPDHPIPPVSRMWYEQSDICNVTHLYSRYQARVDAFQQLPGVENVATTDTVILMTDENAPFT